MLKKVTGAFSRVVLVLAAPGYMELTQEARSCGAIVLLGLAGQEAGYALADVLTGKVCPSGKLSFSWPREARIVRACRAAVGQFPRLPLF